MSFDPKLRIKNRAPFATLEQWGNPSPTTSDGQYIEPGTVVQYCGHVVGGMVKVEHNGQKVIIHPNTTEELS